MRRSIGITLFLLGAALLSCRLDGLAVDAPDQARETSWVRTIDGWERRDEWFSAAVPPLRLHPLVVATGQALLSVLALAACTADPRK